MQQPPPHVPGCSRVNYLHKMSPCIGDCAAAAAAGEADKEELVLRPLGDSFTKPLDSALLLTCQVTGAVENANYDIKWFGTNDREIVERSGRSVTANTHSGL